MKKIDLDLLKLIVFRRNMGQKVSREFVEKNYGQRVFEGLSKETKVQLQPERRNSDAQRKIDYTKQKLSHFMILNWVKYIAITGSVASGNAKKEDDIDILVVVKNNRMWLYRGLVLLKNFSNGNLRSSDGENVEDKFCVNMIVEERGLTVGNNIFNLHELLYMIPIFNGEYKDTIISSNQWMKEFSINLSTISFPKKYYFLWELINFPAFLSQYLYMLIMGHKPNLGRLLKNYKKGRIAFHPEWFKSDKIKEFESEFGHEIRSKNI